MVSVRKRGNVYQYQFDIAPVDGKRKRITYPRIDTLYLICEGLNITLGEFFNDPIFDIENIKIDSKD